MLAGAFPTHQDIAVDRTRRKQVIVETLAACEAGGYLNAAGQWRRLDDPAERVRRSVVHRCEDLPDRAPARFQSSGLVQVVAGDCLEHAERLQSQGLSVCCLNMASPRHPGGGYLRGAGAQEENLCRRSNYSRFLEPSPDRPADLQYPWEDFMGVYSSGVDVFRGTEEAGYPWLDSPYRMALVAVAAYSRPPLTGPPGRQRISPPFDERTRKKVRLALAIPLQHGHNAVVLSALGCGAFANPPGHMAELFAEEIERGGYRYAYRQVLFAILDDANARRIDNPEGNLTPFRRVFNVEEA